MSTRQTKFDLAAPAYAHMARYGRLGRRFVLAASLVSVSPTFLAAQVPSYGQVESGGGARAAVPDSSHLRRSTSPSESWQTPETQFGDQLVDSRSPQSGTSAITQFPFPLTPDPALSVTDTSVVPATATQPARNQTAASQAVADTQPTKRTPLAPPSSATAALDEVGSKTTLQSLVSVGSSLLLVLGIFLGVSWLYRKFGGGGTSTGLPSDVLQIVGRTSIAPRQQMLVVRFGPKLVLVSMVQGEAKTISEISDPREVQNILDQVDGAAPDRDSRSVQNLLIPRAMG